MSAHTPGPWQWDGNPCNYDANNEAPWLVTDAYAVGIEANLRAGVVLKGTIECLHEADARLIAAAPELLEALQECEAYMQDLAQSLMGAGLDMRGGRTMQQLERTRAAIARATGEAA